MTEQRKPSPLSPDDLPGRAHLDWDELASDMADAGGLHPASAEELDDPAGKSDVSEDDDDNAWQDSDEALPDDEEERAIARDPSRDHPRFDES